MTGHEVREQAEALLLHSEAVLRRSVEIVTNDPEADPLAVFPPPGPKRETGGFGLHLTDDQEIALRQAAAELGFGRRTDVTAADAGLLSGYTAILDGGQIHKVLAELKLILDGTVRPSVFVFGATAQRRINSADSGDAKEVASIRWQLGLNDEEPIDDNEYGITLRLLAKIPGFVPLLEPKITSFGYDLQNNFASVEEATGQFVHFGEIDGRSVYMVRIDREEYIDNQGSARSRKPDSGDVMRLVHQMLEGMGESDSQFGYVTSATYQASRQVGTVRASLETGRQIGMITYGTERLAEVKNEKATPPKLNQIAGELHQAARQVGKLRKLLYPAAA